MSAVKIKVSTSALIERVEAKLKEAKADLTKQQLAYEKAKECFDAKVTKALADAAQRAAEGKFKMPRYGDLNQLPGWPATPSKPYDGDVKRIERDLNLLRMSAQENMTISVDGSFGVYL